MDHYTPRMGPQAPSPELTRWVEATLGGAVVLHPIAGGTTALVFCARRRDGGPDDARFAVKQVAVRRAWVQEVDALRALDGLGGAAPRLLAADAGTLGISMTWIDGDDVDPRAPAEPDVWRGAGGVRAQLDRVPARFDDVPLDRAIALRFSGWLARARTVLPAALCADVLARHDPAGFGERPRRWCHRDFGPHNWRVDRGAALRLRCVDFGHARPDEPLVDFVHATVPPFDTPAIIDAFRDGWGVALDHDTWILVAQLALLHGLATATWGRLHDAPRFSELGESILRRGFVRGSPWFVSR